jgi:hypothetical protein
MVMTVLLHGEALTLMWAAVVAMLQLGCELVKRQ